MTIAQLRQKYVSDGDVIEPLFDEPLVTHLHFGSSTDCLVTTGQNISADEGLTEAVCQLVIHHLPMAGAELGPSAYFDGNLSVNFPSGGLANYLMSEDDWVTNWPNGPHQLICVEAGAFDPISDLSSVLQSVIGQNPIDPKLLEAADAAVKRQASIKESPEEWADRLSRAFFTDK